MKQVKFFLSLFAASVVAVGNSNSAEWPMTAGSSPAFAALGSSHASSQSPMSAGFSPASPSLAASAAQGPSTGGYTSLMDLAFTSRKREGEKDIQPKELLKNGYKAKAHSHG